MNIIEIKHVTNHDLVVKVNENATTGDFFEFHLNRDYARRIFLEALQECFVPGTEDQVAEYLLNESPLTQALARNCRRTA